MSENTEIEWADHTFNGWEGCTETGPGCDHCYAKARNARFGGGIAPNWGPGAPRRRTSFANWNLPLKWNANAEVFAAANGGRRQRVFCSSLADVFDNEVPPQWRYDLFGLILATPNLDWLLLTKRIGNARKMLNDVAMGRNALLTANDKYRPPANVWIGATIVNQEEADRDIIKLLKVPAAKRFLSMEPLLVQVNLDVIDINGDSEIFPLRRTTECEDGDGNPSPDLPALDWVIVGGESGPGARPMHPDWVRSLRDQCAAAGVPFLFKQWGEWREPVDGEHYDTTMGRAQKIPAFIIARDGSVRCFEKDHDSKAVLRVGRKAAGRLLDGREWNEVPA